MDWMGELAAMDAEAIAVEGELERAYLDGEPFGPILDRLYAEAVEQAEADELTSPDRGGGPTDDGGAHPPEA